MCPEVCAIKYTWSYDHRATVYTPKVIDDGKIPKLHDGHECQRQQEEEERMKYVEDMNNNRDYGKDRNVPDVVSSASSRSEDMSDEEATTIIPWRAQLRKTNSKLNLLD